MANVIEGLRYSESHEWVKVEGNVAVIGVSDFAQKEMGAITYVDAPEVGDEFEKGEEFGALESVKAASDLFCPLSGKVVEVNEALEDAPELINEDAFANWIIKVEMSDPSEVDTLLDAAGYKAITE
ncbi:MAG: glycine cleavage system protein GcvH [Bacteroidales bacterium]|nr:glycine cleavage system protein GcvH [Bacteroidales bacterium]